MLLDALVSMALLVKHGKRYAAADAAQTFLNRGSEHYIGHIIMHHRHLVPTWAQLDAAVKTGKPQRTDTGADEEQRREAFLLGMYNLAAQQATQIAAELDLSGHRKLLDLGGGPGTYAIHFCRQNPDLKAVVFDLPTTRPYAENIIAHHNMSDRIKFVAGDYIEDALPDNFDVVWLSHILHSVGPRHGQRLLAKAAGALLRDGLFIIHDFFLKESMDGPLFPALFALNMLLATESGQSYSELQVRGMMEHVGLERIERLPYQGPTESGIIWGAMP